MDIYNLADPIEFEWDSGNSTKSYAKHGITNGETESCFFKFNLLLPDLVHSQAEARYRLLAESDEGRILLVALTIRNTKIRVISARVANKKERQIYAQIKTNSKI